MFQRSAVGALLRRSSRPTSSPSSLSFLIRSLSSETTPPQQPQFASKTAQWQHEGILDERGLVNFDTLHNMQVRSCRVFADKNLFATYSEVTQKFEWMTFAECTCSITLCTVAYYNKLLNAGFVAHPHKFLLSLQTRPRWINVGPSCTISTLSQAARLVSFPTIAGNGLPLPLRRIHSARVRCPCTKRSSRRTGHTFSTTRSVPSCLRPTTRFWERCDARCCPMHPR